MTHELPVLQAQPQGFLAVAKNIGIKDDTLDFTVIYSTVRAPAAAMFTRSRFPGAPVIVGRDHISDGYVQALVVNSKNANVATGQRGIEDAQEMCRLVAGELGIDPRDVLPFSTGVIGRPLPMEKIRAGVRGIREALRPDNLEQAARAIMTTDAYPKYIARQVGPAVVAGIAKGAGMIEPNMATMLAYIMTDAEFPSHVLRPMLRRAVDRSFNAVSIDTDTSTSDTVVLMANGLAGRVDRRAFVQALTEVCEHLAREVARNGEGASKLLAVQVSGAKHSRQAKLVAKAVVNSPLVKTAVYGCDPNWGRVVMAVGKCVDEREIEPQRVTIRFGPYTVFALGSPVECSLEELQRYLAQAEVEIGVDLGIAHASARVWGCDLTEGYVKENAYYTT